MEFLTKNNYIFYFFSDFQNKVAEFRGEIRVWGGLGQGRSQDFAQGGAATQKGKYKMEKVQTTIT